MSGIESFHYNIDRGEICINMKQIYSGEYGCTIWPASQLLAKLVVKLQAYFRNKCVLELGCGPGLPGLVAAKCGSVVFLTDKSTPPSILQNCTENCVINGLQNCATVMSLNWGYVSSSFLHIPTIDIVIGADLFYDTKSHAFQVSRLYVGLDGLLSTLSFLRNKTPNCEFLFLFPERLSVDTLKKYLTLWEFDMVIEPYEAVDSTQRMMISMTSNLSLLMKKENLSF